MIRNLVPITAMVLLLPSAAAAHVGGGSGAANTSLMIAGAGVVGVAVVLSVKQKADTSVVRWLLAGGLGLVGVGTAMSTFAEGSEARPKVSIVRPRDGARVPAGEPVAVRVAPEDGAIAASPTDHSGGHLHLYVNGELHQMPYSMRTEVTLDRGTHELKVEFVDHQHEAYDPEVAAEVTVVAR